MTTTTLTGTCPECETELSLPPMVQGETLSCPECMLTLRIETIDQGRITLEMVAVELRDWGQ
ncbi:hypothetical protein [Myceligenerans crystallogenes]|uniref:Alpha-aminoadipate carrier protein LysW n=1 Tax=Myceligenerans crystallogenes TaxID=316335 RepID=A0ABN2N9W5_9MICO